MQNKHKLNTIFRHSAFIAMGLLIGLFVFAIYPSVRIDTNAAVLPVESDTSLTVDAEDIIVDAKVSESGDTFFSATSNLEITTNNYTGYTFRIVADDGDTYNKLIDSNTNEYLSSITSAVSETDFRTEDSFIGTFGYRPSKLNSSENADFLPAPDATGDIIDITSTANENDEANEYEVSLATRVDMSITSGIYVNTYAYVIVPNLAPYTIIYDGNTVDTVSNLPATQENETSETSMTLSNQTPTRAHYDFLGWCEGTTTNTITDQDDIYACDGIIYQPGDTYYLDQTTNNSTTLKAMWEIHKNRLDVNGRLNGTDSTTIEGYGTVDVYINGAKVIDDTTDYAVYWKYGTTYEVTDIKPANGRQYDGLQTSFPLSGTVGEEYIDLRLIFNNTTYSISYNLDGGTTSSNNPTTYNVDTNTFTLTNPTKAGYTFKGWSGTGLTGDDNTTVTISKGSTGNRSYAANWTGNQYTVTLNKNNGSGGSNSVTAIYGSAMPSATMPTRTGYTFAGYYDTSAATGGTQYYKANGTSARSWDKMSNTTLYARWTANTYTIKYNGRLPADDPTAGGEMADTSCTYDQDCTLRANAFHRYQDSFNVWNCVSGCTATNIANGAKVRNLTATNGGTVTLQAQWVGNPSFSDTAIHNIRMTSSSVLFDFTTSVGTSAGNNIKYTLTIGTQTITKTCAAGTSGETCEFTNINVTDILASDNHTIMLFDIDVVDAVTGSGNNHTYTSVYYSYFFYIRQMYCTFRSGCRISKSEAETWRNQSTKMADIVKLVYSNTSEVIPAFNSKTTDQKCDALYRGILGRGIDSSGLTTCRNHVNNGKSISWIAAELANSNEAQPIYTTYGLGAGTTTLPSN